MAMFDKFKEAQKKIYDEEDDTVTRGGSNEKNGYIDRAGDFVLAIEKVKLGKVDNRGSKIDKHHFCAAEAKIEHVRWQKETKPITEERLAAGEKPVPAQPLQEGETKDIFIKLPRFFHENPDDYTITELHMIGDLCDFAGAILGVESDAVDLEQFEALCEENGEQLKGFLFGAAHKEAHYDADEEKGKPERVYLNAEYYPVDEETLERTDPLTAEEVAELTG